MLAGVLLMYNSDTELIFPARIIADLTDQRGKAWRNLVEKILDQEPTSLSRLAFVLMMSRLDGCMTCNADSFRAMRGCTQCALQNIRRFRGMDKELIAMFDQAKKDLKPFYDQLNEGE
jgi:hypothetical protein